MEYIERVCEAKGCNNTLTGPKQKRFCSRGCATRHAIQRKEASYISSTDILKPKPVDPDDPRLYM